MTKTALITGAAGGIGRALCSEFTRAGYRVIATDRVSMDDHHYEAFIKYDLESICKSEASLQEFATLVKECLNDGKLDVLVNNAALQILGRTPDIQLSDWSRTLAVNLTAPFLLTQALLNEMKSAGGSVVNVSSVHASATKPGFVSYATSKAALVGLTQALAVDLGGEIRVNAINPAATATEMLCAGFDDNPGAFDELQSMHPIGRIADPAEVAKVAVFLASENASFITGTSIDVDGGITSRLHDPV